MQALGLKLANGIHQLLHRSADVRQLDDVGVAQQGELAQFGQVGPRMGSVDPGYGTNLLARTVGQKRAKEMWFLCRRYTAEQALAMGLVNAVVPAAQLDSEVKRWCAEILEKSPTALAIAKRTMNADTEMFRGIGNLGNLAVKLYYGTDEAKSIAKAALAKRKTRGKKKT